MSALQKKRKKKKQAGWWVGWLDSAGGGGGYNSFVRSVGPIGSASNFIISSDVVVATALAQQLGWW